jgi:predicted dehydrogenase
MEYILKPKLAIIGAGGIALSHINAAKAVGFELYGICGTPNSLRADKLHNEFNFTRKFRDYNSLIDSGIDAVAVISKTESIVEIYRQVVDLNIPVLVEKPFSINIKDYNSFNLNNSKTLVGYNRRFYSSINMIKETVLKGNFHHCKIHISELSWKPDAQLEEQHLSILDNSVHSLDLITYLFGKCKIINIKKNSKKNQINSIFVTLRSATGQEIDLSVSFGIPINSFIEIWLDESVLLCKPIENFIQYDKIAMFPADEQTKYKRYIPESSKKWLLSKNDYNFKPGFFEQYKEFFELTNGMGLVKGASLVDAEIATNLATDLVNAK